MNDHIFSVSGTQKKRELSEKGFLSKKKVLIFNLY